MAKKIWFHALTLNGEERHIFNPLPDRPEYMPPDALALCGKLVRYRLRSQPWAAAIPECRLCATRGVTLPGRGACSDEWQPYHDARSHPKDCATCGQVTPDSAPYSEPTKAEPTGEPFRRVPIGCTCPLNARTCPHHGAAINRRSGDTGSSLSESPGVA